MVKLREMSNLNIDIDHINNTTKIFLRNQRNELLKQTDKYLVGDYPISEENLVLIKEYRQKLRDFMSLDEVVNYDFAIHKNEVPELPRIPF